MKKLRQLTQLRVSDRIAVATALALSLTAVASQYQAPEIGAQSLDAHSPSQNSEVQPVAKKPVTDPSSDENTHRSRLSARALLFRHG